MGKSFIEENENEDFVDAETDQDWMISSEPEVITNMPNLVTRLWNGAVIVTSPLVNKISEIITPIAVKTTTYVAETVVEILESKNIVSEPVMTLIKAGVQTVKDRPRVLLSLALSAPQIYNIRADFKSLEDFRKNSEQSNDFLTSLHNLQKKLTDRILVSSDEERNSPNFLINILQDALSLKENSPEFSQISYLFRDFESKLSEHVDHNPNIKLKCQDVIDIFKKLNEDFVSSLPQHQRVILLNSFISLLPNNDFLTINDVIDIKNNIIVATHTQRFAPFSFDQLTEILLKSFDTLNLQDLNEKNIDDLFHKAETMMLCELEIISEIGELFKYKSMDLDLLLQDPQNNASEIIQSLINSSPSRGFLNLMEVVEPNIPLLHHIYGKDKTIAEIITKLYDDGRLKYFLQSRRISDLEFTDELKEIFNQAMFNKIKNRNDTISKFTSNIYSTVPTVEGDINNFVNSLNIVSFIPKDLRAGIPESFVNAAAPIFTRMVIAIIKSNSEEEIAEILKSIYRFDGEINYSKVTQLMIKILSDEITQKLLMEDLQELLTTSENQATLQNILDFIITITPEGPIKESIDAVVKYFNINPSAIGEIIQGVISGVGIYIKYNELTNIKEKLINPILSDDERVNLLQLQNQLLENISIAISNQISIYLPHIASMLQTMPDERILSYIEQYPSIKNIIDIKAEDLSKLREIPRTILNSKIFTPENIHTSLEIYDLYSRLASEKSLEQKTEQVKKLSENLIELLKKTSISEFLNFHNEQISTLVCSVKFLPGINGEKLTLNQYGTLNQVDINPLIQDLERVTSNILEIVTNDELQESITKIMSNIILLSTDDGENKEITKTNIVNILEEFEILKKSSPEFKKIIDKKIPEFIEKYNEILAPLLEDIIQKTLVAKFHLRAEEILPVVAEHISSLTKILTKYEKDGINLKLCVTVLCFVVTKPDVLKLCVKAIKRSIFPIELASHIALSTGKSDKTSFVKQIQQQHANTTDINRVI